MPTDLNLSTVELTSTLRTAPLNGSPSSSDYNNSQRETLVDLASIVDFINNQLLPLVNALPAGALQPPSSPVGLEGRTIWSDTSDQSTVFFNALTTQPLSIADSMRILNGMLTTMSQQLIDLGIEVASLQATLASTNRNDISLALQNLSASLNQLTVTQQTHTAQISQILISKVTSARSTSTLVAAGGSASVTVNFPIAYPDTLYTVTSTAEVTDGPANALIMADGIVKNGGTGVTVGVSNDDVSNHNVIVHVMAIHD